MSNNYKKFIKKYGSLIFSLGLLLIVVLQITIPSIKEIKKIHHEFLNERKNIEELYVKGQNLKKSKNEFVQVSQEIDLLDQVFIKEQNELEFITTLEKLAENSNINHHLELATDNKTTTGNLEKMPFNLSLVGDYLDLLNYLQQIENLDLYLNINHLSFTQNKTTANKLNDNTTHQVTARLQGNIFYNNHQKLDQ